MSLSDGPYNEDIDDDITLHSTLIKHMIHPNEVLDHFWRCWKMEYHLKLRNTHREPPGKGVNRMIRVGEVVVVQDTNCPREFWKLVHVESLIKGSHGRVRGASVRIRSPDNHYAHLQRPIQLLYPLEVCSPIDSSHTKHSQTDGTVPSSDNKEDANDDREDSVTPTNTSDDGRPLRRAAQNAREIV